MIRTEVTLPRLFALTHGEEGLKDLKLMAALYEAAASNRSVSL